MFLHEMQGEGETKYLFPKFYVDPSEFCNPMLPLD